jgi:hypothetical protein
VIIPLLPRSAGEATPFVAEVGTEALRRDPSQATQFVAELAPGAAPPGDGFDWGDAAIGAGPACSPPPCSPRARAPCAATVRALRAGSRPPRKGLSKATLPLPHAHDRPGVSGRRAGRLLAAFPG